MPAYTTSQQQTHAGRENRPGWFSLEFLLRTTASAHCWAEGGERIGSGPRSQMGDTDRGSAAMLRIRGRTRRVAAEES